jgi:hypothetical protein
MLLAAFIAMLAVGTVQATRTRACQIGGRTDPAKIAVWIACGLLGVLLLHPPLLLALPALALMLVLSSILVSLLARLAWRVGL